MKTLFKIMALLCIVAVSCNKVGAEQGEVAENDAAETDMIIAPIELTKAEGEMSQTINGFAIDVYRQAYKESASSDLLLSPLSLAIDLSMLSSGAKGETARQIYNTLGLSNKPIDEIDRYFKKLCFGLSTVDEESTFSSSNSVWFNKGFEIKKDFSDKLSESYNAYCKTLDFNEEGAVKAINDWCSEQTEGKIRDIVDQQAISGEIALILNAVYFKAPWGFKMTADSQKTQFNGVTIQNLTYMQTTRYLKYLEDENMQMASLPYGDGAFSMIIILPKETIDQTLESLSQDMLDKMNYENVQVRLPEFEIAQRNMLAPWLTQMGLSLPFSSEADFSGICESDLKISSITQSTYIKVNREGTEASGVTGGLIGSPGPGVSPIEFTADKPFVYMIYEQSSGTIIFIGHKM